MAKMTLDDVIKYLKAMAESAKCPADEWYEGADDGMDGILRAVKYLQTHRAEIKEGMRPALRFKRDPLTQRWWLLDHHEDFTDYFESDGRAGCERFAASLGMTAEFIENSIKEYPKLRADLTAHREHLKQIVSVCESPSALYDAIEEARDFLNNPTVAKNATAQGEDDD